MITVSIVEDDDDIRETLALLIDGSHGFRCASHFCDCEGALAAIVEDPPDVVLMDIELPGMSGIEGAARIKERLPDTDVVMLTIHKDDDLVFQALSAGATGYLLKDSGPEAILAAVRNVREGGAPMSSNVARMIVGSFRKATESPLSPRETDVLAQLCKGQSYRMIGETLFISEDTVHFHIKNIYKKLSVHSKSAAVAKALKDKLV
jgi:DNA-binding NarL/FixJ family response regulator